MAATPEKATVSKSNTLTAIAAPAGYKWVDNGDGTSTLAPCEFVAKIGETKYETLKEAVAAVQADGTITMLKDVDLTENIECTSSFTLTFGDYTITKGNYSVAINAGVTITTDKPTDIFTSTAGRVVENTVESGYAYSVEVGQFDKLVLEDGVPYPEYLRANGGHANEVTYTHKFGKHRTTGEPVYSSWWVPFNYTVTDEDAEKFDFFTIHMIAGAPEQGEMEENSNKIWIYIVKEKSGKLLKAGHLYVVKPKETVTSHQFMATNVNLLPENFYPDDPTKFIKETSTSDYSYHFYGTYVGYTTTKPNDVMWLSSSNTIDFNISPNIKLGSYRWLIKVRAKGNPDDADAKVVIGFKEGEGDTDGINNAQVNYDEIEGIYTLGGMKVEHPVKGVNIIKYTDGRTKKINVK